MNSYPAPHRILDPDVAALLRQHRQARGWSYRLAQKRTGISYGYLANLEAGRRVPSVVVAETLISAYRIQGPDAAAVRAVALEGVGRAAPPSWSPHWKSPAV